MLIRWNWRDRLRIDRRTLSGGTFLLFLNLLFAIGLFLYERFLEPEPEFDFRREQLSGWKKDRDTSFSFRPDSLFAFDPNELSLKGWRSIGLTKDQARVIINYRKSGGRFYSEEDLLRVYSVREEHLEAWSDYLRFPRKPVEEEPRPNASTKAERNESAKDLGQVEAFPFDPNQLPEERWTELGLSPEQAAVVMEFREAGGRFWKAADLLDLYVVDSALFWKWKPYVRIDREALKVAIDRADEEEFERLPGIGKVRAGRIIEYRELLGGFHRTAQLKEVYGLPDSLLRPLLKRVKVEDTALDRIPLDTNAKHLMRHPYIDPEQAEAIREHRSRYGAFEKKSELRELDLLSAEEYRKIAPYLELASDEQ